MHRSFNVPRGFVAPLLSVLALSLFIAPQTTHAQWAQWGGPNRDFVIDSKGLAAKWPEDGPKKLWTRELGEGYSAIVAEGDRLYTMYRGGDQERIVALNAKNGETIWETPYDAKPHEEHVSQFGDGPRSTPLIDGDKMYTIGVSGVMHCVNKADGKVNWKKDLWKEMSGTFLNHGYSSSPMAYKDTIIVLVGGEDHAIVAFNKSDGSVKWQKQSFGNSYSSPRLYKVDGSEQLITFMGTEVVGLNPDNGDLLWSFPHENQWKQNVCMPVMGPDNILVISAPEAGTKGLKLTRTGSDWKAEPAWESRKVQFYHTTAIPVDNCVYGSTGGATGGPAFFAAIDMKTGKVLWRERGLAKATALYADATLSFSMKTVSSRSPRPPRRNSKSSARAPCSTRWRGLCRPFPARRSSCATRRPSSPSTSAAPTVRDREVGCPIASAVGKSNSVGWVRDRSRTHLFALFCSGGPNDNTAANPSRFTLFPLLRVLRVLRGEIL